MISITNDMLHPNKPLTNSRYDFSLYRQLFFNLLRIVFNNFSIFLPFLVLTKFGILKSYPLAKKIDIGSSI